MQERIATIAGQTIQEAGGILDCSAFYPSITSAYSNDHTLVPFLRVNELVNGLVSLTSNTVFLPQTVLDKNAKTIAIAYPGDIVLAKGGNTLAKVGLVTEEYPAYATCRDVIILRTHQLKGIGRYFLWAFLHSKYGQAMMWRAATQTGQPHLTLTAIANLHIPHASMVLQDAFEKIYTTSVAHRSKAQAFYQKAKSLLEQAMDLEQKEIAKQQISVRSLNEILSAGRIDAEYYQPKYDDLKSILHRHPVKSLGELVTIQKSIEPGSSEYQADGIPFYRVADLSPFWLGTPSVHLSPRDYATALRPKKDTILLSKDGSIGIACKVEEDLDGITSSALLHLTLVDDACNPDYLTLVLNSSVVKMQAEQAAGGSIIQHWLMDDIRNVEIPLLGREEQAQIQTLLQRAHADRVAANNLLATARRAVECFIEQGEAAALAVLASDSEA